ncbi:MAG TPA: hypothetical protein VG323_14685 [Thermoanaerobaculia bacterium]|nr:hypothetical protein [Thermoanaerobaculia bacterium]
MRRTFFVALLLAASLARAQEDPALWRAYYDAVSDSAIYNPLKLRTLKPVVADANGNVLVIALGPSAWTAGLTQTGGDVWVTLVPEVQTKCKQYGADAPMRLRQLLGLPPYSPKAYVIFNVFQVRAASLFRPAPDPETGTTMPCPNPPPPNCGNEYPASATPAHISWISNNTLFSYQTPQTPPSGSKPTVGYPWTRLGYTYDWGAKDHYGASEYIIPKGTVIAVVSSADIKGYCK